jgi:hypothetical protein
MNYQHIDIYVDQKYTVILQFEGFYFNRGFITEYRIPYETPGILLSFYLFHITILVSGRFLFIL